MSDPASPRRLLPAYLALAGLYFGLHSLLLVLIPVAARGQFTTAATGVVLMLYSGLGIVADIPAGRAAGRYGVRSVVLAGAAVMLMGAGVLAVPNAIAVVVAAVVLGAGSSLLLTPILGGLASAAGNRQRGPQVVNASVQRLGALIISLYVSAAVSGGIGTAWLGAAVLAALIAATATRLPVSVGKLPPSLLMQRRHGVQAVRTMYRHALQIAVRSRQVAAGLVANVIIGAVMIFGFSFFPVILLDRGQADLLGFALATRELVAIGSAVAAGTILRRVPVRRCFIGSLVLTIGSLMALIVVSDPAAICLLFAVQGAAMAFGIIASNSHIYEGTSDANRMYGFAAGGVTARFSGIVVPIVYGFAATSPTALLMTAMAILALAAGTYGSLQPSRPHTT